MFPANQVIYKEPLKHHPRIQTRPLGLVLDFFQKGGLDRAMGTRLRETHKSRFP